MTDTKSVCVSRLPQSYPNDRYQKCFCSKTTTVLSEWPMPKAFVYQDYHSPIWMTDTKSVCVSRLPQSYLNYRYQKCFCSKTTTVQSEWPMPKAFVYQDYHSPIWMTDTKIVSVARLPQSYLNDRYQKCFCSKTTTVLSEWPYQKCLCSKTTTVLSEWPIPKVFM